jgi:DNA-binding transcriptional MocR family regulator
MTYKSHRLDIYGTQLHLARTKAEWKKLRKQHRYLDKHVQDIAGQCTFHTGNGGTIHLWINVDIHADHLELIDSAAHEASHAAGRILEHAGHKVNGTDEPHAYLCGWLTRWIFEACDDAR